MKNKVITKENINFTESQPENYNGERNQDEQNWGIVCVQKQKLDKAQIIHVPESDCVTGNNRDGNISSINEKKFDGMNNVTNNVNSKIKVAFVKPDVNHTDTINSSVKNENINEIETNTETNDSIILDNSNNSSFTHEYESSVRIVSAG